MFIFRHIFKGILYSACVLFLLILVALGYRSYLQNGRESSIEINTPEGVMEEGYVGIGGIEQWVSIRGCDRSNPVILYIHGGPGGALSPFATFTNWEKDYTVVMWDQRGSGLTRSRSGPVTQDTTIDLIAQDGIAVAKYALKRLDKSNLILIGSSWGSVIGVQIAQARPDLVSMYVGTGQFVSMSEGDRVGYQLVLEQARSSGNSKAVEELQAIGPPPYHEQQSFRIERQWAQAFESGDSSTSSFLAALLTAPHYSLRDGYSWIMGLNENTNHFFGSSMDGEFMHEEIIRRGTIFDMPVLVIQGKNDNITPVSLSEKWLDEISAPYKKLVTIPGAGHTVSVTHSDQFLTVLKDQAPR